MRSGDRPGLQNRRAASSMLPVCSTHTRFRQNKGLSAVLARRAADLATPIQMCDALSRNLPKTLEVILGNCLAHGRRRFVKVAQNFPEPCRFVLETLAEIYRPFRDELRLAVRSKCASLARQSELERAAAARGIRLSEWIREALFRELRGSDPTNSVNHVNHGRRLLTEVLGLRFPDQRAFSHVTRRVTERRAIQRNHTAGEGK